jgi:ABC-type Fe3+/spermidine/putrescine transport system ATPase subunit
MGPVDVEGEAQTGANVALAIRPEDVTIGRASADGLPFPAARITDVLFQGSFKRVRAVTAGTEFLARIPADAPLREGDVVDFHCAGRNVILLTR